MWNMSYAIHHYVQEKGSTAAGKRQRMIAHLEENENVDFYYFNGEEFLPWEQYIDVVRTYMSVKKTQVRYS